MAIPQDAIAQARQKLQGAVRPLFLHDDDCDGVSSFILGFRLCKDDKGVPVKNSPVVKKEYLRKVEENSPDLIVILDKPRVDEEFFQKTSTPILWIDHHEPQTEMAKKFPHVTYLNPRIWDDKDNRPTSYWMYKITQQNLWIAVIGSVGDWHLPDYLDEFKAKYPHLLPEKYQKVEDLYLDTPIGTLIRILQFNLKGTTTDVRSSISTLAKIDNPDEILKQTTAKGRLLWKRYQRLASAYEVMLQEAKNTAEKSGSILLFLYEDTANTFTPELSNELLIRYPKKIIFVGRKHEGKWKCSVRSKDMELPTKIHAALQGLDGHGGGHTNACGLVVREDQWEEFYTRFSDLVSASVSVPEQKESKKSTSKA